LNFYLACFHFHQQLQFSPLWSTGACVPIIINNYVICIIFSIVTIYNEFAKCFIFHPLNQYVTSLAKWYFISLC
jgi:uncharacterized CHY-type Zn-finger protein